MNSLSTTSVVYNGAEIQVPSTSSIAAVMDKFGLALDETQILQVQRYYSCLVFWNQRVSLTSVVDPIEILERHFAEGMIAGPLISRKNGRLADVGSGPGFPGLALKIVLPKLQVFLIERDTKKSVFLNEVIRFLNLDLATVIRSDYASIPPTAAKYDVITARAIGNHKQLLSWSLTRLKPDGQLMLWLGGQDSTKVSQSETWRWDPPMPIPHSQRRVILIGHPIL